MALWMIDTTEAMHGMNGIRAQLIYEPFIPNNQWIVEACILLVIYYWQPSLKSRLR